MNGFIALHALRQRIEAACRKHPAYSYRGTEGAVIRLGLEEQGWLEDFVRSSEARVYLKPALSGGAESLFGFEIHRTKDVSGVALTYPQ